MCSPLNVPASASVGLNVAGGPFSAVWPMLTLLVVRAHVYRAEITDLAARYRVPAIYWSRSYTELGGLISYGPYLVEEYRRAASYVDRILRGEKPSVLPVQAPVKYEFTINLKALT